MFYSGNSMRGTLKSKDILEIQPVCQEQINVGDIIAFHPHGSMNQSTPLVHRVIKITPEGWITRGDNNQAIDPETVPPKNLIGRVVSMERRGKVLSLRGGWVGKCRAQFITAKKGIMKIPNSFLRLPYQWLRKNGLIPKIWQPRIKELHFQTPDGLLIKFCTTQKCVANFWTASKRIAWRKPYDLVLFPRIRELQKKGIQS